MVAATEFGACAGLKVLAPNLTGTQAIGPFLLQQRILAGAHVAVVMPLLGRFPMLAGVTGIHKLSSGFLASFSRSLSKSHSPMA